MQLWVAMNWAYFGNGPRLDPNTKEIKIESEATCKIPETLYVQMAKCFFSNGPTRAEQEAAIIKSQKEFLKNVQPPEPDRMHPSSLELGYSPRVQFRGNLKDQNPHEHGKIRTAQEEKGPSSGSRATRDEGEQPGPV